MEHRILFVGDSPYLNTGFSYIHRELGMYLYNQGIAVESIGLWDKRRSMDEKTSNNYTIPWNVHICKPPFHNYSLSRYVEVLESFKPTLIIMITDIWIAKYFMNTPITKAFYFHVEGEPLPYITKGTEKQNIHWPGVLMKNDYVVFAGPFGKDTTLNRMSEYLKKIDSTVKIEDLEQKWPIIPNGVDTNVFRPLANKSSLKTLLWGLEPDSMVIGFFSRQNARKGLPYALEAFANWPKRPENAYFYCHCAMEDKFGWDLKQMIIDLKIDDRVIVNTDFKVGEGVDYETLNKLYNACDVVVSPSLGEGFGQTTCLVKGTMVKTKAGMIPIETVKPGDEVATHMGRFKKVLEVYETKWNNVVYNLKTYGKEGFTTTPAHEIFSKSMTRRLGRNKFGHSIEWLKKGDFLKYPIMNPGEKWEGQKENLINSKNLISSTIPSIIYNFRDVLYSFGRAVSNYIIKTAVVGKQIYNLRILKSQKLKTETINGVAYVYHKIISCRCGRYDGNVYNMNVEEDHSFLVNGIAAVHNCQSLSCGVPVIITDYSELKAFDKGTLKIQPIAFYVETGTNIRRALPGVNDIIECYKKVYNKKIKKEMLEARESIMKYDSKAINEVWMKFINSIPVVSLEEKLGFTPNMDEYNIKPRNIEPASIIICVKEKPELLRGVMTTIEKTVGNPHEIIIHDTGSTSDIMLALLKKYEERLNVKILRSNPSVFNFSKANNEAVKLAKYDNLIFLNNDITIGSTVGWANILLWAIGDPQVGMAGPKLFFPNGAIQHAGLFLGINGLAGHTYIGRPGNFAPASYSREVTALTGACIAMRKSVFNEVGGFDEGYIIEFQDVDLALKVREKGYKIIYAAEANLVHHVASTRGNPTWGMVINDRPLFCKKWNKEIKVGDKFLPLHLQDPTRIVLADMWRDLNDKNRIRDYDLQ